MDFQIANRIRDVQGSIIRELFKLTKDPNIISFGGGNPSPQAFPIEEIARITANAFEKDPVAMLQYGLSEGYTPLRDALRQYLTKNENFNFDNNEIFIVSGGQQAADLVAKTLVNEGDVVITEEPSFIGNLNAFRSYGAKLVGVPAQPDGMDIEKLEQALKENKNAKLIYIIPSFQNPTGFTTSRQKRERILALANQYNIPVLEDNPYGELRFSGESVPTLKSLDKDGRVLYTGSFSKVMAPAFRVGFLVFDKALTPRLTVAKQCTDVHTNVLFQHICYEYMKTCDYKGHIEKIRRLYKHKADLMLNAMERHFHPAVRFNRPEGGIFVMAFLPEGMDGNLFVREGIAKGVACVPGVAFTVDQSVPNNGFRMNYSTPSDEQIEKGVEILGKLTYSWIENSK